MAWVQYVDQGNEGVGGYTYWVDDATGAVSYTDPTQSQQPAAALPSYVEQYAVPGTGFEGQGASIGTRIRGVDIGDIANTFSMGGYTVNGNPGGTIVNPFTGQREQAYQTAMISGGVGNAILPKSLALEIDPNAAPYQNFPDGGYGGLGGFLDKWIVPAAMAAVGAAGATGLGAAGAEFGSNAIGADILGEQFGGIGGSFGGTAAGAGAGAGTLMPPATPPSHLGYTASPFTSASGVPATEWTLTNIGEAATGMGLPAVGGGSLFSTLAEKFGPTAAKSLFDRLTSGDISTSDLMRLAGSLGGAALGAYGANQQASAYRELADKYMGFGEPSRARYEATFQPGFTMASDPGYTDALNQTAKGILHGLSTSGNPADSPNAWATSLKDLNEKFAYPALQDYRRTNAAGGGLTTLASAAPAAASNAIQSQGGVYNAAGSAMADIFNPPTTLTDLVRQLQGVKYA